MNIPHSPEAEMAVLGTVLVRPESIHDLAELADTDFYTPANVDMLRAMRAIAARGERVDTITLGEELPGCLGRLVELMGAVPSAEGLGHWLNIVRAKGLQRRLVAFGATVTARAQAGDDAEATISDAIRQLAGMSTNDSAGGPRRLGDHLSDVLHAIEEKVRDKGKRGVATGIRSFDTLIGALQPPNLIVVAARPGVGKTALATTIARNAAKGGVPVLVFSLEMGFQQIGERFLSAESLVCGNDMNRGSINATDFRALHAAGGRLEGVPLYVDDRVMTAAQISATARSWFLRQQTDKALVIVDYLGLIRATADERNREREVAIMSWTMKTLAKELHVPVVLVSQLNRAAEQQDRPSLANLRESGAIEQDADMVIFPIRSQPLHDSGPAELLVAKNRFGPTGSVECHWAAPTMTFTDCDNT
jgi:replicative DNA helicase